MLLPDDLPSEERFTRTVIERTTELRAETIARHLDGAPAHLTRPLDQLLQEFATDNAIGMSAAFHYCDWRWGDEIDDDDLELRFDEDLHSDFATHIWGPIVVALVLRCLSHQGPVAREVAAGLDAFGDRAMAFTEEKHLIAPADDTVLPELFDILAAAYATGAAVALSATRRRGPGPGADGEVDDVRELGALWLSRADQALGRLGKVERALIEARYAERLPFEELGAWMLRRGSKRGWSARTMHRRLAGVLATVHAWGGHVADRSVPARAPEHRTTSAPRAVVSSSPRGTWTTPHSKPGSKTP